jgi:hypothetical protein
MSTSTTKLEYTPGGGFQAPQKTTIGTPPISPFRTNYSVGSVFYTQVQVALPAIAAGAFGNVNTNVAITGFPNTISLPKSGTGQIVPVVSVASMAQGLLIGAPQVIVKASGQPNSTLTSGTNLANPSLFISISAYAPAAVAQQAVTLNVWALLLGTSG